MWPCMYGHGHGPSRRTRKVLFELTGTLTQARGARDICPHTIHKPPVSHLGSGAPNTPSPHRCQIHIQLAVAQRTPRLSELRCCVSSRVCALFDGDLRFKFIIHILAFDPNSNVLWRRSTVIAFLQPFKCSSVDAAAALAAVSECLARAPHWMARSPACTVGGPAAGSRIFIFLFPHRYHRTTST